MLSYFDLISPDPIPVAGIGRVISPKLSSVSSIGLDTYQFYLTILQMDLKLYLTMTGNEDRYESFSEQEQAQITVFELLSADPQLALLLQNALNFFMAEEVVYLPARSVFAVRDTSAADAKDTPSGFITRENFSELSRVIFQRNGIRPDKKEDLSRIKSRKALEIARKLQEGRSQKARHANTDKNLELGNIISAVANRHPSINLLNIWDLTVYQVWDCFMRLSNNNIYDIQSMRIAAWGNKDHDFDESAWFKRMDSDN